MTIAIDNLERLREVSAAGVPVNQALADSIVRAAASEGEQPAEVAWPFEREN